MSLIAILRDRARRRKTRSADWHLPDAGDPARRQAALVAEVRQSLVPRRVVLSGDAGRIVIEAGHRRLFGATVAPAAGPEERFDPGTEPAPGPAFRTALAAVLAGETLAIAYEPAEGPWTDGDGCPAETVLGPPVGRAARFLDLARPLADDAAPLAPPDQAPTLGRVLPALSGAHGGGVLCILIAAESDAVPTLAVAHDGVTGVVASLPRNRLGPLLRAWDEAGREIA